MFLVYASNYLDDIAHKTRTRRKESIITYENSD